MLRWLTGSALALALCVSPLSAEPSKKKPVCEDGSCGGEFGTSLQFEKSPSDAARKALKEEKLVCVLHISGHFEDPEFT